MALYLGLMSGTSMDGVDAVLIEADALPATAAVQVVAHGHWPMPAELRRRLIALNQVGSDELHGAALAANGISALYARAVRSLLEAARVDSNEVVALGAHGQTVRHRPGEFDSSGYTIQLLNGALLAELTDIDVVCDFRSRDVAAGGQGAPLVPAFHGAMWSRAGQALSVLNIGGIANLSLLKADGAVGGFDCGPGNVLMDLWCEQHLAQAFDAEGVWAASGQVHTGLLARMLADPYFERAPPKSTGRDLFHGAWLRNCLEGLQNQAKIRAQDVQATLAQLTAQTAASALRLHLPESARLLVCGGGALNTQLMRLLAEQLPGIPVQSTAAVGMPPLQVEAAAFAWLAQAFTRRLPGNRPEVTGASGLRLLGALYPAR